MCLSSSSFPGLSKFSSTLLMALDVPLLRRKSRWDTFDVFAEAGLPKNSTRNSMSPAPGRTNKNKWRATHVPVGSAPKKHHFSIHVSRTCAGEGCAKAHRMNKCAFRTLPAKSHAGALYVSSSWTNRSNQEKYFVMDSSDLSVPNRKRQRPMACPDGEEAGCKIAHTRPRCARRLRFSKTSRCRAHVLCLWEKRIRNTQERFNVLVRPGRSKQYFVEAMSGVLGSRLEKPRGFDAMFSFW